ncbi:hypothetical protein JHK85_042533 [Glycine max]|nr:hypothetical protein JHK86_041919 [Glycine max]KAG4956153.1 hypothetical protein JHK85_042533 [Glycine max]
MRVTSSIDHDEAYFESYARISVHEQLLKDKARTDAYLHAIIRHEEFIRDKVVLDVGCGTGILAILCAQAGAKRDVEIKEQVDVIISEWMGYMLLHKNMLESVITARDRWLKPGGLMLPSKATLYMAPVTNTKRYEESINYWNSVYGINTPLHGFAFWFDVEFGPSPMPLSIRYPTSSVDDHPPVDSQTRRDPTLLLSTAPNVLPTHWQQVQYIFSISNSNMLA